MTARRSSRARSSPRKSGRPSGQTDHNYFQDPEAFLALGGRRGKQLQVLTDGTFFINRWFATVEMHAQDADPHRLCRRGGRLLRRQGEDVTGDELPLRRAGGAGPARRVEAQLPPGKYALNPYALKVELVPTVNFVLRWITGVTEAHQYDKDLDAASS